MFNEKGAEASKQEEKPPEPHLSPKDYELIARQALKVDPSLAHAYFRQAGWPEKDIEKTLTDAKAAAKEEKRPGMSPQEKKELYEKMADDLVIKYGETQQEEYYQLALTYLGAAEKEAEKIKDTAEKAGKDERE